MSVPGSPEIYTFRAYTRLTGFQGPHRRGNFWTKYKI